MFESVNIVKILSAKSRSGKEAFHHPAFTGNCPTTSHTSVTPMVVEILVDRYVGKSEEELKVGLICGEAVPSGSRYSLNMTSGM